ncbi:unnamed protein product [Cuscuta epithymum]|uniref:Uncharacterized protein n=1 Tax=Cuscuta epithymum TaxID=186058 RepID=A0AAV0FFK3_9ASTE|nr:unnamed protein product [Cuscuta epithymum]
MSISKQISIAFVVAAIAIIPLLASACISLDAADVADNYPIGDYDENLVRTMRQCIKDALTQRDGDCVDDMDAIKEYCITYRKLICDKFMKYDDAIKAKC